MTAVLASAVVAAVVSGIVSLLVAKMTARAQDLREDRTWQRNARVQVYMAVLDSFQQVVSKAMASALDVFVWKFAHAASQDKNPEPPERIKAVVRQLEDTEGEFSAARSRAVIVSSTECIKLLDKMSHIVFEVGTSGRHGADTNSDEWHAWREEASQLRLAFGNEARRSLGFENLEDWPSFADFDVPES